MVIGVIVVVLITMGPYLQRLIQGSIKLTADQIGFQENADQDFAEAFLNSSFTTTDAISDKRTEERRDQGTTYTYGDVVNTQSNAQVNIGFTETPQ